MTAATIKVEVRLYATLRQVRPELGIGEPLCLAVADGATVEELLRDELGIPAQVVKLIFVNGVAQGPGYVLAGGDRVAVLPPIAGGWT